MKEELVISRTQARRIAILAQCLAGPRSATDAQGIMDVISQLSYLQLDPINIVSRSHLLVLWSRLGSYDPAILDTLQWQEHQLFEYWAHAASIVLARDYPLFQVAMRNYGKGDSSWSQKVLPWMEQNEALRISILSALQQRGPLRSRDFVDTAVVPWPSSGWTGGRNVGRMLDFLWTQGYIMVAGRNGGEKWWDLMERCLPTSVSTELLPEYEVERCAAQKSLRALGIATAREIAQHFTCDGYPHLSQVLADLEAAQRIVRVSVQEQGKELLGPWFIHAETLPVLSALENSDWQPRTTLLSPFDNLICDRERTMRLFDFTYRSEIYTPKHKRRYGYYVMPILSGDQLIGRIDPLLNRASKQLLINAVHVEPTTRLTSETGQAVANAIEELATFLGATTINYSQQVPESWKYFLA